MGAIVSSPPGASSTTEVRVAVSSTGARTSRWVSLRVHGNATAFAWVVPVKPSAFVDLTSDAWLESLEDATAPRVVPPDVTPACGTGGVEVDGTLSHVVTTVPDSVATAADVATLGNTLAGWGITVTGDLAPLLDAAGADGDSFVALLYSTASPDVVTRTVRIVDTSPATIPLALTSASSSTVTVTAYAFTTGSVSLGTAPALAVDPTMLLWQADDTSTYVPVRNTLLSTNPGAWLVETAGHPELFDGELVPGSSAIAALAPTYFSRAWTYGDASGAPSACSAAASAIATSLSPVGIACAAGGLARVGSASCVEAPADGDVPPDDLRCGGISDDLAIALSGMAPAGAWLTRARSVLSPGSFGADTSLSPDSNASSATGPVITCSGYDETCGQGSGSGGAPPPSGGSTSSSGGAASGGGSSDPGSGGNVASTVGNVVGAALDASSSTDDGCGGDSSEDSGDSCSSDGGGGDSAGGDGCSGDSSPDCTLARPRGRHAPTSRILLLVVALAAVARRRGRGAVRLPAS